MGIYAKVWTFIIYILIFIMGVAQFLSKTDDLIRNRITDSSTKFVNECRTTGLIDTDNFYRYCNKIYALGSYEIEIEHSSLRYYPDDENGWRPGYYIYTMDDILSEMYPGDGRIEYDYEMKTGDSIEIKIKKTRKTMAENILTKIFGIYIEQNELIFNYSGNVGNSGK